jgi:uncharacterized protein
MKRIMLILLISAILIAPAWAQQTYLYDDRPKISVNGEAVVNVKPDKILVSFGIETSNLEIMVAKQKNNEILKKAIVAIKGCGVAEKDIQTDRLSIEPRYRDGYRRESFIGYFVQNRFVVTLSETDKVEELVTKVLQAGVNYIHGIDFQTTEFKKYREQARELALKAAKEKADKMAAVLGEKVGAPIQINENYPGFWGHGRNDLMTQNVAQNIPSGSGDISETISLGKISIRANVAVTFELKK